MKRILQEPLLHFLLLGAGLFVVYGLIPTRDKIGEHEIQFGSGLDLGGHDEREDA